MAQSYDIFLSHNSKNKDAVRELAEALRSRGLEVWLDEWELVPGQPWMEALETVIQTTRSSAVLVGKDGFGPWQSVEMRDCLQQFVNRKLPVIPVLLPGAAEKPDLPPFLVQFTWVDLRGGLTELGIDQLLWGVTGKKPFRPKRPSPPTAPPSGETVPRATSAAFELKSPPPGQAAQRPIPVQFCEGAKLELHRAFFRSHSSGDVSPLPFPAPQIGERWRVVAERDAAHQVPRTGDGRKVNPPALVAWSPKGDRLFTSCDAFGLTAWDVRSVGWGPDIRKLGEDLNPAGYGYPVRFFVAQRGASIHVLQETRSYRHAYHLLHDGTACPVCSDLNESLWGWGSGWSDWSGLERNEGLEPWRPGSDRELAIVHDYSSLKIVDVTTLPNRPVADKSWANEVLDWITGRNSSGDPRKVPLLEAPARQWISFDDLGAWGKTIFRFHFHPSGEYLAVTTGDWDNQQHRRVHIVHLSSALIVASLPATTEARGWSPSGRFLLCKRTVESKGPKKEHPTVWDGLHFEENPDPPDEVLSQPWALKAISTDRESAISVDGQRLLTDSAQVVSSAHREGFRVRPAEELARIGSLPFAHAAWHPSDPHCFVTVGGEPSKQFPDTYGRDRQSPHGRLLRIWRLSL